MRNVSGHNRRGNQNTHFVWKSSVEPGRPHMKLWRLGIACWINKATNTQSEYVTVIDFPLQHWLHDAPQWYITTCISCLVKFSFSCRDVRWYLDFLNNVNSCNNCLVRTKLATLHDFRLVSFKIESIYKLP